jgi:hypothetical protein
MNPRKNSIRGFELMVFGALGRKPLVAITLSASEKFLQVKANAAELGLQNDRIH